jgi:WD40-like Beta Propeller Repeat
MESWSRAKGRSIHVQKSLFLITRVAFLTGAGLLLGWGHTAAQAPSTDIYLADLSVFDGVYFLGGLKNVTGRPDAYDNQPSFTADSKSILFTSAFDDGNDGQTDIRRYYVESDRIVRVTRTEIESEYSATAIPGDQAFSAIRVEADSVQRLWRFTMQGMDGEPVLREIAPVGYHAWADDANTLILFVLGQPPTLQIATVESQRGVVLDQNPGRSLHKIPNRNAFSYVARASEDEAWISEVDIGTHQISRIIKSVDAGQDHAWTPDGVVLMGSGGKLFQYNPEVDSTWREIADFGRQGLTLSRLAVSPDGSKIAIVAMAGDD